MLLRLKSGKYACIKQAQYIAAVSCSANGPGLGGAGLGFWLRGKPRRAWDRCMGGTWHWCLAWCMGGACGAGHFGVGVNDVVYCCTWAILCAQSCALNKLLLLSRLSGAYSIIQI